MEVNTIEQVLRFKYVKIMIKIKISLFHEENNFLMRNNGFEDKKIK